MKKKNFRLGALGMIAILSAVMLMSFTTSATRRVEPEAQVMVERKPLVVRAALVGLGGIKLPLLLGQISNVNTGELRPGTVLETVVLLQAQAGDLLQVSAANLPLTLSVVTAQEMEAGNKEIQVIRLFLTAKKFQKQP